MPSIAKRSTLLHAMRWNTWGLLRFQFNPQYFVWSSSWPLPFKRWVVTRNGSLIYRVFGKSIIRAEQSTRKVGRSPYQRTVANQFCRRYCWKFCEINKVFGVETSCLVGSCLEGVGRSVKYVQKDVAVLLPSTLYECHSARYIILMSNTNRSSSYTSPSTMSSHKAYTSNKLR